MKLPSQVRSKVRPAGMVLVVTLVIIVLLTAVILAFFSHVLSEQKIETSRANRIKVRVLGRTGQEYVVGKMHEAITSTSTVQTSGDISLYSPINAAAVIPERKINPAITDSDLNFINLIRQSVPESDANASTHSTTSAARTGRIIGVKRWNAPSLTGGEGFATDAQAPHWIYVTKSGGLTPTPSADVIGRISYNVYDLSGLLDANIAGYPAALTNPSQLKNSDAGADLTKLPAITEDAVNLLLGFRDIGTDYIKSITAFQQDGFLTLSSSTYRRQAFVNRQDLLRYARTQNSGITEALPCLTHFVRSANAPSWDRSNPGLVLIRFTNGGSLTHYRDDGTTEPAYQVNAGEPFLQRKFSLAKLAWLTPRGPAANISNEAIQACFGLLWNTAEERWDYVGPNGTTVLSTIGTVDAAAAETLPREPNFFELLKAGILPGALGSAADAATPKVDKTTTTSLCAADNQPFDESKDLHLLKIAANIIDNADPDNFPTILALKAGAIAIERAGVEDLPLLYGLDTGTIRSILRPVAPSSYYTIPAFDFVWIPEFFNPHQASPAASTEGPTEVALEISSGYLTQVGFVGGGGWAFLAKPKSSDLSTFPPLTIPSAKFESFRSGPGPVRDEASPLRLSSQVPSANPSLGDVLAFRVFSYGDTGSYTKTGWPAGRTTFPIQISSMDKTPGLMVNNLILRLRYKTPQGRFKTYLTLGGQDALPSTGIDGKVPDDAGAGVVLLRHGNQLSTLLDEDQALFPSPMLTAWDPRGSRYGPGMERHSRKMSDPPKFTASSSTSELVSPNPFSSISPFLGTGGTPNSRFGGNLPQMPLFRDPDGNVRPPDGNVGFKAPGTTATAANPYKGLSTQTARPSVLQRPFQSVAELGYVYRDIPWQTLNFWNEQSADAGLLELFTQMDQPPVVAGTPGLFGRRSDVRTAILSRTGTGADGSSPIPFAGEVAKEFELFTLSNAASAPSGATSLPSFTAWCRAKGIALDPIKYRSEAISRSLAAGQSRTWNLFVDVIAQTGRFSPRTSSFGPSDFIVEAEDRSWSSIAIDRLTAKVLDRQIEYVDE